MENKIQIKKLQIPAVVCPICNKKLIKTSSIAVITNKIITHGSSKCCMKYLINENQKLPEQSRERMSIWDGSYRFTEEYEKSSKGISEEKLKEYQSMFRKVFLLTNHIIVKKIVRERVWNALGQRYLRELQSIHLLNRIFDKNKDKWQLGFRTTFIPSILSQFKIKGYLSKKQWVLVERFVNENSDDDDREYHFIALQRASDMTTVELPDRLRYMQRKHSFMEWYNNKNGIAEETE